MSLIPVDELLSAQSADEVFDLLLSMLEQQQVPARSWRKAGALRTILRASAIVTGKWGDGADWGGTLGFGHDCTSAEYGEIRSFLKSYKPAHARIRAVVWIPQDYGGAGAGLNWCNPAIPAGASGLATFPGGSVGGWMAADGTPSRPSWMRFWEL